MEYNWSFKVILSYQEALWRGAIVTLELTGITIVTGTALGLVLALARMARFRSLRWPASAVIEVLRAIPLLVLLVWFYYCLPIVSGLRISNFAAAGMALSINLAAFAAETFRAGIEAIPPGHIEAARSLGMTHYQAMRRVILPQAARQMLPPLVGLYITMLKFTSLASVIAVSELLHAANDIISRTYRPLEIYTVIAIIYAILVLPGALLSRRLESTALFKRG